MKTPNWLKLLATIFCPWLVVLVLRYQIKRAALVLERATWDDGRDKWRY